MGGLVFFLVITLGPLALFFPKTMIAFKEKLPWLFYLLFIGAILVQFPIWFLASWGTGMSVLENNFLTFLNEISPFLAFVIFILLTGLGLYIQKLVFKDIKSLAVALFGAIISSTTLVFIFLNFLDLAF